MLRKLLGRWRANHQARGGVVVRVGLVDHPARGLYAILVARSPEDEEFVFSTREFRVLSLPLESSTWYCYRTGLLTVTLTPASGGKSLTIETLEF